MCHRNTSLFFFTFKISTSRDRQQITLPQPDAASLNLSNSIKPVENKIR